MTGSAVIVSLPVKASPERAFAGFTEDIGRWWQASPLFPLTVAGSEVLEFVPGIGGELIAHSPDGRRFVVGRISVWEPGVRLVLGWRQESFSDALATELEVRFEPVDEETQVTVEHRGWDRVPADHVARHGFPLMVFQQREAEHWQLLLRRLAADIAGH